MNTNRWIQIGLAATLVAFTGAEAFAGTIAVPKMRGSKRSGVSGAAKAVRAALRARGHEVVGPSALSRASRDVDSGPASPEAAQAAGATVLVLGRVKKIRGRYRLTLTAVETASGDQIATASRKYKSKRSAPKVARALVRKMIGDIEGALGGGGEMAAEEEEEEEEPEDRRIVAADPDPAPEPASLVADDEETTARVIPKDEDESAAVATVVKDEPSDGREPLLTFRAGVGTQAATAYTVAVGAQVTALAYRLSPLLLIDAGARLTIPGTALGIDAGFMFAPVKYALDTEPAVNPASPSGAFVNLAFAVLYGLDIAQFSATSRMVLEPFVGFGLESLSVDEQQPFSIVIGNNSFVPKLGAHTRFIFGDNLELVVDTHLRLVASYSESPATTGESGSGIGVGLGLDARYWFGKTFGVHLGLGYNFSKIAFAGNGSRPTFQNDPTLLDASLFSSNLRAGAGLLIAL